MEGPWDDYKQSSQAATTSQSNNSPSGPWDDYASPEPAQTSPTLQRGSTRFSDYVKAPIAGLVEGVGSGVAGIGSLAKLVSPAHYARTLAANSQSPIVRGIGDVTSTVADAIPNALQYVGGKINSLGQKIEGSESQAAQEGQAQPIVQGQLLHPSTWKLGAGATLPGVVLKGENLIGNIAPMFVAPEAAGAKVLGAAGKAAGELGEAANAVRAGTALSDLSPEVAQAATKLTRNVARAKQVTGAGVGGVQMAEGQAQGEQARIEQMPQDQLEQVPAYQQAIAAGMTPDQARAHVAQNAHDAAFAATLPLAVAQGGISTLPLLNNTQGVLARAVGKSRLARGIAGAALEAPVQGGAFVGQNAADIAAVNATTGEQRSPMEDSLATFGSGAVMGAAFGGIGGLHRPAEPFPGAAPGSLSDAANTLQRAAGPAPEAQGQGAPAGAESKPVTVKAPPPPAPWINPETGDVRTPDGTEVVAALHGLLDQKAAAAQNGQSIMFAPKDVADAWGLPLDRVKTLMRVTANERRAGMTTEQAQQRAAQEAQVADQNAIANPQIAIANPASQDVVGDGKPTDTPSVQSDTAGGSAPDTTSMAAQPEAVAPEGALAQSDLLTNPKMDVSDRQKARIAQRVRGGGVAPGLLDAAAEEATAGARTEPVPTPREPAPPSDNAHLDTQPEKPPQGGVSASETPNEEPTHANEQQEPQQSASSATPGGTGRGDGSAARDAAVEGGSAAPATGGAAARPAPAAGGETGTRAVDTTGLENALSKTDRATGPDGATYLVKENSNGEGYHFNRLEDGSSTQHRNSDPAQPWNREQAISAAAQMARERSALTATVTPDTAGTKFHSASTGDMQERPTVRAGESGSLAEPAQSGGAAEGNQTLPRADHKAQLAAVQAANDSYLESARIAAVRDRMQEEYDSGQNQHHLSIDTHGLDRDEDGDLTDKGMAEYDHRVAQAIQSAARDAAGKIRSLEDIDHHGTKLQAYNAAKAWLDAQGIHYRELDSAGSRYLEVEAPAGSKADEEGEALKLRFATHEQQTRRHKQTPFNWVQGGGGKPLADILEAARKFARAPVSDASAGADAGTAAPTPSAQESARAGQATAAEPVSQASGAPKASNAAETTTKTPETQAAADTGDAEAAFAKRAAAIAARFRAGEFGANSKRAPEYKQAWLQGYRGEPFPRAGVDDGFIDRAYRAGEVAADYDSGRRSGEANDRASGPDGATYLVKENSNGEGYHFNRLEDGSSTQYRNADQAQPWTREQAISAAAQMAREQSAAKSEPSASEASARAAQEKKAEQHPGFLVHSLETGKTTELKLNPAREESKTAKAGGGTPSARISDWVKGELEAGRRIDAKTLFDRSNDAFGGTQAEGKYTPKDAYDALELGVNKYVLDHPELSPGADADPARAIEELRKLTNRLPTQTKRTQEQDEFQQFSTVPTFAYVANWVANLRPGDHVLEPSAGIGGLAAFAKRAGADVTVNELSPRRAEVLRELGFPTHTENAEQLHNVLPDEVKPTAVVMNPPFSATAGRIKGQRSLKNGEVHVEQALKRLEPGGRLVAIVGNGMAADKRGVAAWWDKIKAEYNVRANIGLPGAEYAKYGTTFDNQLIVIDKTGPTKGSILTGKVATMADAPALLRGIRDDRQPVARGAGEPTATQPAGEEPAASGRATAERRGDVPAAARAMGTGSGEASGSAPAPAHPVDAGNREPNAAATGHAAPDRAERQRNAAAGQQPGQADASAGGGSPASAPAAHDERIEVAPSPKSKGVTASPDADVAGYRPAKLNFPGAKRHPGKLVESAAMGAVEFPDASYRPNLPKSVVTDGKLSDAQLETVTYAGQAHAQDLPDGSRRGFFIGDGTGVGKGREISGIMLDNLRQGAGGGKHVWISEKSGLLADAKRDFAGVGGNPDLVFAHSKTKASDAIQADRGVLFTTYATLRSAEKKTLTEKAGDTKPKTRLQQIVDWLGPDFDGVIAFDEAHNMGNAIAIKGKRGVQKPSAQALAGVELQRLLPRAKVVYVSATGATEVANLSYATRLGLWGEKTAFATPSDFIAQIDEGGLAAMELVSRDMKQLGVYTARALSYDGVTYGRLEHELTPFQTDVYNELARAWQGVLRNVNDALEKTGVKGADRPTNGSAKSAALSAFWGSQQRFFNQVITAMQMPTVLEQMRKDLEAGNSVVVQLVNTNEAIQNRQIAARGGDGETPADLEDLDLTPRENLLQYVKNSFPVQQFEVRTDDEGNKHTVAVTDSKGAPVFNKEAIAAREALLETLQNIRVPDGPLEMLLNEFGENAVAEVTGRSQRLVRVRQKDGTTKTVLQRRSGSAARADAEAFQAGKKRILVFSDAGGTGFSFHADRTAKNQERRMHYLVQPGWRADKAVQGFGRTHRSNEASAPHYYLPTTNLPAQKRFISSIARRLDQLGALTKGQRDAGSQGLLSAKDNLESKYAAQAIDRLIRDAYHGKVEGMTFGDFTDALGFDSLVDKDGGLNESKIPDVPQFLNRLLSLTTDQQGTVFEHFSSRLDAQVQQAIADGTLDTGLQTLKADKVHVLGEHVVYTDPHTGAETKYVELELTQPSKLNSFPPQSTFTRYEFVRNNKSGRVWAVREAGTHTKASGAIVDRVSMLSPTSSRVVEKSVIGEGFEPLTRNEAAALWKSESEAAPKTFTEPAHLITGALLPIWDRLAGDVRVVRVQTDTGEQYLGRYINPTDLPETLKRLQVNSSAASMKAPDVADAVLRQGKTVELANGWQLERKTVAGEKRIEVMRAPMYMPAVQTELKRAGAFIERINYQERAFVPTGETGHEVLQRILDSRPVAGIVGEDEGESSFSRPQQGASRGTLNRDRVQQIVNEATAKWGSNRPSVRVVADAEGLPDSAKRDPGYKTAEGYYDPATGTAYLVASNLRNEARVQQVLAHEAIGHHGVEHIVDDVFGRGAMQKIEDAVTRLEGNANASEKVKDLLAETRRRYPDADPRTFAKEFLAVSAEKGVRTGLLDRVVAAIRTFLRKIMPSLKINEADLRQALVRAQDYVRSSERYADRVARMQAMVFSRQPDTFYSALAESVGRAEGAPKKGTAEQWRQWLDGAQRRGEFKGAEREWMGVDQWLDTHKGEPITRAEVQQFARDNQVRLQEVVHGDEPPSNAADIHENEDGSFDLTDEAGALANTPDRPTKFSDYQLPGGKNYRELLLTLPAKEAPPHGSIERLPNGLFRVDAPRLQARLFKTRAEAEAETHRLGQLFEKDKAGNYTSSHFDTPNILAHVRFNDRTGPDGEKILHVEEVQSDWHQAGRKQGYKDDALKQRLDAKFARGESLTPEESDAYNARVNDAVPDAPFKKEWPMLAMKRVLRYAAEHGYDKVTWTTGEQQAARYDLSKQVREVSWTGSHDGAHKSVDITPREGNPIEFMVGPDGVIGGHGGPSGTEFDGRNITDVLGKELGERVLSETHGEASGNGLKVGGDGMSAFYDKMIPNELNKYAKQWGAKVGVTQIKTDEMPWTKDRTTVHSVDITPAMRAGVMAGQPMFSRPEQATMDDLDKVMSAPDPDRSMFDKAKAWLGGKGEDLRPAALGLLQTRHVLELVEHVEPLKGYGKQYGRSMQQLDTDRSHLLIGAPNLPDKPHDPKDMLAKGAVPIAQALRDYTYKKGPAGWLGQRTAEGKALFDMMHQATINGMDPDKEYQRLTIENAHGDAIPWTKELVSQRLKLLREQALQRGGDPVMREKITEEKKYLRNIAKMERSREQRWPELVRQWHALPEEAKELYRNTRDWYAQHRDAVEEALVKNIEGYDVPETYRRSLVNRMRLQFEEARRSGVYFPLNRDGDYWISFQDAHGNEGFKMFESSSAAASAELKLKRAGYQINATGRRDPNAKAKSAPPGTFVRELIDILKKAGVSEKTQDAIYQSFLQTLPEMSMRKHSIHRRNIAGFSEDGLRAFAKNSFHGAHQLAKLRHLQDMQTTLEAMQQTVDAWRKGGDEMNEGQGRGIGDTAKADALVGELAKRHQWIMAPTDAQLANHANALGFVWYLGASPASALTNLTQVVQTVLPVLGAQHGWPKATRMLGAAWRDAARTGGHMDRTLTDPDERRAFLVMQQRGDFSKTQAHTLAGLAEGNVLQTSPGWTKIMNAVSWMFHTAEVINREATGMAAFRLARAQGKDFNEAIKYAGDINAGTNFDYAAANRPRLMQNNTARIALQFKQYGVGMSWLFYRNLYQAMKGETPEVRRQARRTVTGILGMTALLAGTTGLPIYNGVKAAANAANLAFGDPDQPFDFDTEFHAWLAEHLGQEAANVIATGPVSELTGADIANRTSMSNLFFQNNDQNLEGADAYHALLESLAGPMGGITKNFYVGAQRIREGNVQRGIETMLPTSVKNAVKALRFAHDGANTLRGDPILPDISGPQDFIQALGFTPTKLAQQQATNSALMNFTQAVQERRQTLLNGYAMAVHSGDPEDRAAVMDKIRAFNQQYPAIAISPKVIMRSLRSRAQYSARAVNGLAISPKLRMQAEAFAGANQGTAQ